VFSLCSIVWPKFVAVFFPLPLGCLCNLSMLHSYKTSNLFVPSFSSRILFLRVIFCQQVSFDKWDGAILDCLQLKSRRLFVVAFIYSMVLKIVCGCLYLLYGLLLFKPLVSVGH
jgi:hypothetical protein